MAGDPHFNSVKLLLHMDEEGSPDTFLDNSSIGHIINQEGGVAISPTTKKFGTGSGFFDGTDDRLNISGSGGHFDLPADFTIEAWLNVDGSAQSQGIFMRSTTGDTRYLLWVHGPSDTEPTGTLGLFVRKFSTPLALVFSTTDVRGVGWVHVAITRSGDTWRMFIDGVEENSRNTSLGPDNSSDTLYIGGRASDAEYNGYMDDVRFTKGVARYTANFTPPTQAFPNNAGASASGVAGANPVVTVLGG